MTNKLYDVLIVGSGPAGLTASIYASRYKLSNLVTGVLPGGTITYAHEVENFPGLPGVSGLELGQKMLEHAKSLGGEFLGEKVVEVAKAQSEEGEGFKVVTSGGKEFLAKTLIVATGTERRKLGVPGEEEFLGKGVSYCVTCDANFYKDKVVALVGGSNAACSGAVHLAKICQKVYLIYRRSSLRAEPVWVEEVKRNPKIEVIYETNLVKIEGDLKVRRVVLDKPYQGREELEVEGVFVEIGGVPSSELAEKLGVELDEEGYIKVNELMQTNIPGVFAAGDVTNKSKVLAQVITACGQGAVAANSVFEYLKGSK